MRQALFLCLLTMFSGCKTLSSGRESSTSSASGAGVQDVCEDTCAGSMASPDLLGCVVSCSAFKSSQVNIKAGVSIYPLRKKDAKCNFIYEKRDSNRVEAGTFFESFSYSFQYSEGIGDGSFYMIGSGLTDASKIVDFTGTQDKKEVGDLQEGGVTTVSFLRADKGHEGLPTFSAEGLDKITGETKHLLIILDKEFNPKDPFAKIKSTSFKVEDDKKLKHDIQCLK